MDFIKILACLGVWAIASNLFVQLFLKGETSNGNQEESRSQDEG